MPAATPEAQVERMTRCAKSTSRHPATSETPPPLTLIKTHPMLAPIAKHLLWTEAEEEEAWGQGLL
jgi:hypothetical protein